jgi:hypothetical protein
MLVTDPAVRAAHARRDLPVGLRYGVVRLAELLDPAAPFALAGCAYCDPAAAVRAFASAAADFLARPAVRFGTVLAASQLLTDALRQEGNLRHWYPGEVARLLDFTAALRKVPEQKTVGERRQKVPYHERTSWVRQRLEALMGGSLARFQAAIDHPETGYRERLLSGLATRLVASAVGEREWAELDHDLSYTAALLLAEGRDGCELARRIAQCLASAESANGAIRDLRSLITEGQSWYTVVLAMGGVDSLGASVTSAFGLEMVSAHEGTAVLQTAVLAWDPEHARLQAILAAGNLRDHLVAAHAGSAPQLMPEVLVRGPDGREQRVGQPRPVVDAGPVPAVVAELQPFLRANALARAELSPALRVLHTWIALEHLARDGGPSNGAGPGSAVTHRLDAYLPPDLAAMAALTGLWDQFATGRAHALSLGPDLSGPFPNRRLGSLARQLEKGPRLAKAAEAIQVRASIAIARLKLARHLVVHQGLDDALATTSLALSGLHLLASAHQVLSRWAVPGRPAGNALAEARAQHDANLRRWRTLAHAVEPDEMKAPPPEALSSPEVHRPEPVGSSRVTHR